MTLTRFLAALPSVSHIKRVCGVARGRAASHSPKRETVTQGAFQLLVAFLLLQVLATPAAAIEDDFLCQKVFFTESGEVMQYPEGHENSGEVVSLSKGETVTLEYQENEWLNMEIIGVDWSSDRQVTLSYEDGQYKTFVKTLRNIVGVLMVMGPVAGIIMYLFATVARTTQMDGGSGGGGGANYSQARRDALVYGFSVPIAAYALEVLVGAIVGYNFGCLVP